MKSFRALNTADSFYCEAEQVRLDLKCSRQCASCHKDQHGTELENKASDEVATLEQLAELDQDEIVAGYREGWDDPSTPIGKNKGYMHGWLNAQVDKRRMESSEAQRRLAHEIVHRRAK